VSVRWYSVLCLYLCSSISVSPCPSVSVCLSVCSNETCESGTDLKMCPLCEICPYWNLSDVCVYTKAAYLFDHPGTVFYAVFTAFWGLYVIVNITTIVMTSINMLPSSSKPATSRSLQLVMSVRLSVSFFVIFQINLREYEQQIGCWYL